LTATPQNRLPRGRRGTRATALVLGGIVVGMIGAAYAAEPFYRLFCEVTGYGGAPRIAENPGGDAIDRTVTVRFDANVNDSLGWEFRPVVRQMVVRLGEAALAEYEAVNVGSETVVGSATFNVTPYRAAPYFNKVDCFCFTEQVLAAGESKRMPVSFFIDPKMIEDAYAEGVRTITLSYTFFASPDQSAASDPSKSREGAVGGNLPGQGILPDLSKLREKTSRWSGENG
jgi:cytochrome c oxidase assembly protein subunit 11